VDSTRARTAKTQSLTHGASAAVMLVGAATLLGWWLDIEPLKRGIGDAVAMNPATAICFILTGASLWLPRAEPAAPWTRRVATTLAASVALVAIVRLAGYVIGAEVGVDRLLFPERLADAVAGRPNRMAPNTALCFLLAGAAVLVLDVETRRGRRPAQFLALATGAIALQALLGYVYGTVFLVGAASFIPMAFNTAAAFLVLSAGVLAARPGRGWLVLPASWSLRRRVNVGFGIALCVLLVTAVASVWGNFRAAAATQERSAANRRRIGLLRLETLMEEAIRGERGYLLTGDSLFLRPYTDARDSLPAALESATALFEELPVAAPRFSTLGPLVQDAMTVFTLTVSLDKSGDRAGATQMVRQGLGKLFMDGIRDTIRGLLADDEARADRLDVSARVATRLAIVTNVGAGLLAMVLLMGAILTINRDITKRERAEAALRESERQLAAQYRRLEELEGLRDNLVHMLVHDLRSPLTAIRANLDLIQLDAADALNPELVESITETRTAAIRMTDMVGDVLDVSRMEAGQLPLERAELDLGALAAEAMASVGASERVRLEQLPGSVRAFCDASLIRRVIANLVANAMKFTPAHGQILVRVTADASGQNVSIADTGPGIPQEYHEKIFEKFGQAEASRAGAQRSSGLGLTFCKLAVEAHGGRIGVESVIGKGSTFWFTLPAEVAQRS
jgi:signal transduction histidine kinase